MRTRLLLWDTSHTPANRAVAASNPPAHSQQLASRPRPLPVIVVHASPAGPASLLAAPAFSRRTLLPVLRSGVYPSFPRVPLSQPRRCTASRISCAAAGPRHLRHPSSPSLPQRPHMNSTRPSFSVHITSLATSARLARSAAPVGWRAGPPRTRAAESAPGRLWGPRGGGLSVLVFCCLYISPAYAPPRLIPSACGPSVPCSIFAALRLRLSLPPSLPRTYVHTSPLSRFLLLDFFLFFFFLLSLFARGRGVWPGSTV